MASRVYVADGEGNCRVEFVLRGVAVAAVAILALTFLSMIVDAQREPPVVQLSEPQKKGSLNWVVERSFA
jgi:hypothetical protein